MAKIDSLYKSSLLFNETIPTTKTFNSAFNYSIAENLYGSDILLYTGQIPGTNPLASSGDGDKYAVNGVDIIEKIEGQVLSTVEDSYYAFTDSRMTYVIPNGLNYPITLFSKDAAGDYTVVIPANFYDVFYYQSTGTYVIYFNEKYFPIYNNGDLDNPAYPPAITCYRYCGPKGIENMPAGTDEKAKVSSNDTTAGYLNGKLVAGSNITLTENNNGGNETLTISADGGGGGLTGFTGSQNSTGVNITVNASQLLADAASANADIVLSPKGTGAILAQLPDGTTTGGNKRGDYSVDLQRSRSSNQSVASAFYSLIGNGQNNRITADSDRSSILNGTGNIITASNDSVISGGSTNKITKQGSNVSRYNTIAGGQQNEIIQVLNSTQNSTISGGTGNYIEDSNGATISGGSGNYIESGGPASTISGGGGNLIGDYDGLLSDGYATIVGGNNNIATGAFSVVLGGNQAYAYNKFTVVSGWYCQATQFGQRVHGTGGFTTNGDCQYETMDVLGTTTSGSPVVLTANRLTAASGNVMKVDNNTSKAFQGLILARRTDAGGAGQTIAWKVDGLIVNNGGTTSLLGTPTITLLGDSTTSGATVTVTADDTLDCLAITGTGGVGKTFRWHATISFTTLSN
jgi:hypothetical protein